MLKNITVAVHGYKMVRDEWSKDQWVQQINRLHWYTMGSYVLPCNDKEITVKEGNYYLFPSNLPYWPRYEKGGYIEHRYIDFFTVPCITGSEVIEIDPKKHPVLGDALSLCFRISQALNQDISQEMKEEYEKIIAGAVSQAMDLIRLEFPVTFSENRRVNAAVEYIHNHYAEELNLDLLSERAYCAKNYFVRLFREEMGCTPYQYIKNYRFMIARDLLRKGNNVKAVARAVGYGDSYAFSAAFYKQFKVYPSAYQTATQI